MTVDSADVLDKFLTQDRRLCSALALSTVLDITANWIHHLGIDSHAWGASLISRYISLLLPLAKTHDLYEQQV